MDSNVIRCAVRKGRTSSLGLGPIIRRITALCTAAGIYVSIPYTPTRLNCSDDPTRGREVRPPTAGLCLHEWSKDEVFQLASIPKLKRWASNWTRLILRILGPTALKLHDRSLYRHGALVSTKAPGRDPWVEPDFDGTKGYPGEGPSPHRTFPCPNWISMLGFYLAVVFMFQLSSLIPRAGPPVPLWLTFCSLSVGAGCRGKSFLLLQLSASSAMAMPIAATTPAEVRKAALRKGKTLLESGRPVTEATSRLRTKYWSAFALWVSEQGVDLEYMLDNHYSCVDEINFLMVKYGRLLYASGKTYTQYAETINALSSRKPPLRRMLQQCWDLGYSWMRNEPSTHHVAIPVPLILSMITTALLWGWVRVAGCLGIGFAGLLRPGEITGAYRRDLLLPRDIANSVAYAVLSIRQPKSRFTYARHQAAKIDSPDFLQLIDAAFGNLKDHEPLWPQSAQTLRARFKSLLGALKLPTVSVPGLRALDLGSLRSGGATFIIQSSELCRRRGRWASYKMMDIYVQETMALQYIKLIDDEARVFNLAVAAAFPSVLERIISFVNAGIPTKVWYVLLSR